jgi:hypothetical protein
MTIEMLIKELKALKKEHGNIEVVIGSSGCGCCGGGEAEEPVASLGKIDYKDDTQVLWLDDGRWDH